MTQQEKFTEACLDNNTLTELREALTGPADPFDMKDWGLTESEWRTAIQAAIEEMENE